MGSKNERPVIRDEDITVRKWTGPKVRIQLVHRPTLTVVEASDISELVARYKAKVLLRDALEGYLES